MKFKGLFMVLVAGLICVSFIGCGKKESTRAKGARIEEPRQGDVSKEKTKYGAKFWSRPLTIETIRAAIASGADVNARLGGEQWGYTPLMKVVIYNSDPEIISELVKRGANINARGPNLETALLLAFQHNSNPDVIERLLQEKADIRAKSVFGGAETYAVKNKNLEIVKWYMKSKDRMPMAVVLHQALLNNASSETVSFLLGIKDNDYVYASFDKLLEVAFENNCDTTNLLKIVELAKNLRSDFSFDLSTAARYSSNPDLISALIASGANPHYFSRKYGMTPLMVAAKYNSNPEVIDQLIKAGVSIQAVDEQGNCAAVYARDNPNIRGSDVFWILCDKSNYTIR